MPTGGVTILNKFGKSSWFILWLTLASTPLTGLSAADDCQPIDREKSISKVLKENSGGKVLKVEEKLNDSGCKELEIRSLINGTVKAIVVSK